MYTRSVYMVKTEREGRQRGEDWWNANNNLHPHRGGGRTAHSTPTYLTDMYHPRGQVLCCRYVSLYLTTAVGREEPRSAWVIIPRKRALRSWDWRALYFICIDRYRLIECTTTTRTLFCFTCSMLVVLACCRALSVYDTHNAQQHSSSSTSTYTS